MTFSVNWLKFIARWLLPASLQPFRVHSSLAMALVAVFSTSTALVQTAPVAAQPQSVEAEAATTEQATAANPGGLITIESDIQTADNLTGVVTAAGNVRIVYPSRGMVATARQAQYFSQEGRLVLSGDVDVVQDGGNALRAERVVYLLEQERTEAEPPPGQQVFSQMVIRSGRPASTPLTP